MLLYEPVSNHRSRHRYIRRDCYRLRRGEGAVWDDRLPISLLHPLPFSGGRVPAGQERQTGTHGKVAVQGTWTLKGPEIDENSLFMVQAINTLL